MMAAGATEITAGEGTVASGCSAETVHPERIPRVRISIIAVNRIFMAVSFLIFVRICKLAVEYTKNAAGLLLPRYALPENLGLMAL